MPNIPDEMAELEILRAACCVAAQDGRISAAEREILERLADRAGVGDVSLAAMIETAESDPDENREQFELVRTNPVPTLRALTAIAAVDGGASGDQHDVLEAFATRLGIEKSTLREMLGAAEDGDRESA